MILQDNPVRSALYLVLVLFSVAMLFLSLHAVFIAAVQIIVYAGAIMVLFIFVIMLLNLGTPERIVDRLKPQKPLAWVAAWRSWPCWRRSSPASRPTREAAGRPHRPAGDRHGAVLGRLAVPV